MRKRNLTLDSSTSPKAGAEGDRSRFCPHTNDYQDQKYEDKPFFPRTQTQFPDLQAHKWWTLLCFEGNSKPYLRLFLFSLLLKTQARIPKKYCSTFQAFHFHPNPIQPIKPEYIALRPRNIWHHFHKYYYQTSTIFKKVTRPLPKLHIPHYPHQRCNAQVFFKGNLGKY